MDSPFRSSRAFSPSNSRWVQFEGASIAIFFFFFFFLRSLTVTPSVVRNVVARSYTTDKKGMDAGGAVAAHYCLASLGVTVWIAGGQRGGGNVLEVWASVDQRQRMRIVVSSSPASRGHFGGGGRPFPGLRPLLYRRCLFGQLLGVNSLRTRVIAWWLCFLALVPLLIDWSAQYWLHFPSTNTRRFITGLLAGYGEVALVVLVFAIS